MLAVIGAVVVGLVLYGLFCIAFGVIRLWVMMGRNRN